MLRVSARIAFRESQQVVAVNVYLESGKSDFVQYPLRERVIELKILQSEIRMIGIRIRARHRIIGIVYMDRRSYGTFGMSTRLPAVERIRLRLDIPCREMHCTAAY